MRLSHIIEAVYCKPWLITPTAHSAVRRLVESKLAGTTSPEVMDLLPGEPDDSTPYCYSVQNGIACIDVRGVIGKNLSFIEKSCGACGVEDIAASLNLGLADSSVTAFLLYIDSPGGTVSGVPELAAKIAQANKTKRVYAFVDGMACSAAYWLACGAEEIFVTQTSDVGSIGVYQAFLDESMAFAAQGYAWQVMQAGKYKTEGLPGTKLSPEFKAMMQAEVDTIYGWFSAFVRMNRPAVKDSTMQGQSFMGEAAIKAGLADKIISDQADALALMR